MPVVSVAVLMNIMLPREQLLWKATGKDKQVQGQVYDGTGMEDTDYLCEAVHLLFSFYSNKNSKQFLPDVILKWVHLFRQVTSEGFVF